MPDNCFQRNMRYLCNIVNICKNDGLREKESMAIPKIKRYQLMAKNNKNSGLYLKKSGPFTDFNKCHPPSSSPMQPRILRVIAWASARAASSQRHASTWPCCAERCSAVLRSSPLVESSNDVALPLLVAKVTWNTGQETLRFTRFQHVSHGKN